MTGAVLHLSSASSRIGAAGMIVHSARRARASASSRRRAAEGIARQPSAADKITGAVNLPLFLLEGVAILAEVFVLLIVLLK